MTLLTGADTDWGDADQDDDDVKIIRALIV